MLASDRVRVKWFLPIASTLVLAACEAASDPSSTASSPQPTTAAAPSPTPAFERLEYYEPLLLTMAGLERGQGYGSIVIRREICETVSGFPDRKEVCDDAFTRGEQEELIRRLAARTNDPVQFFSLPEERWPRRADVVVWVGTPEPHGDDLWIRAGMLCGGLCGEGGTFVLERRGERWVVEGHAPGSPTWIA